MSPSDHESPFTLASVVATLRRRTGLLLAVTLAVPALALVLSLVQEEQYTAEASLLFRDPALDQKLFGAPFLEPSRDPAREAATNVRLVSLDVVAARTARRLPGAMDSEQVGDKVAVTPEGQSDVVTIAATDPDPRFAARLANEFATQYIAFRRQADRSKVREAQQLVERLLGSLTPAELAGPRGRSLSERAEQLQVLASLQTGNAELVQPARKPESPSSPDTVRNVALGVVLGLLLGLGLALLLDRLDRRIRDPREFETIFQRPLLAYIPESRALARGGPAQEQRLPPGEQEAFRMLRANLRYFSVDRPVRSVLVTSAAPGDGKSTVSWNLALAAASTGTRVLLMETDLRHPTLARSAPDLAATPGLSTVLAGQVEFAEVVQSVMVPVHAGARAPNRMIDVVVAGPIPPNPADLIESESMRRVLSEAEQRYELVVIDTPPTSLVSDAIPLIREVSGVIVVARPGKSTRESISQLRRQLENLDAPTLGVVVNAFKPERGAYGYGYGYGYGAPDADADAETAPSATAQPNGGPRAEEMPTEGERLGR